MLHRHIYPAGQKKRSTRANVLPHANATIRYYSSQDIIMALLEYDARAPIIPNQPLPFSTRKAPRSTGSSLSKKQPLLSLDPAARQPHATGAPPKAATVFSNQAAPRSGSSTKSSLLLSVIEQPRAARAPPQSSFFLSPIEQPRETGAPPKAASSCL